MQAELSEVLKDAVVTVLVIILSMAVNAIKGYYNAGREKVLSEVDCITDTSLRIAVRDAVLAVEQIADNFIKAGEVKYTSEEKLQLAVDILEKKGFDVEVSDIEAAIKQFKERAAYK